MPQLAPESLVTNSANGNFDPRIRGTVVHDFSAPRPPRRNVSYNDIREEPSSGNPLKNRRSPNGNLSSADEGSPWSGGNHTPVFTENFEEEQYPHAGPHVRKASDLTDLSLPQPAYARGAQKHVEPNSTSKSNEPAQVWDSRAQDLQSHVSPIPESPDRPPPVPPKADVKPPVESRRISIDTSSTPPRAPSSRTGRPRNVSQVSMKDAALPKHMKSTSSRFSFDMIGAAKQEKLLEDRHRQKALERKADEDEEAKNEDEFENDYDYDNMDDDDGLEERIPGVNADLEEEEYPYDDDLFEEPIPGVNADLEEEEEEEEVLTQFATDDGHLGGFTFQQSNLATPMSPTSPGFVSTPRDADGQVIGFAMTKNSPYAPQALTTSETPTTPLSPELSLPNQKLEVKGLGLHGVPTSRFMQPPASQALEPNVTREFPRPAKVDDDELYFDDGIIGDLADGEDEAEFDESVFDNVDTDQYGRPLQSLSTLPTLYSPPMLTADPSPSLNKAHDPVIVGEPTSAISPMTIPPYRGLAPQPSITGNGHDLTQDSFALPPTQILTQDTLAAYQSALAAAAFTAAANGKFRRDSVNPSELEDTQPGLINDSGETSHYEPFSPSYDQEDDFNYDDVLEDDPIIAAANAEALANDPDGFYGQEFGFYSAPATSDSQFGGYFGPRGSQGVARGLSNRIVSREPNLTPITERSEYSNRNSFMSLSMGMHGPSSAMSPGLAQLTSMLRSPDFDGDMSFDALLKLRRGAWGGSQASLHSSTGSPRSAAGLDDGSPVGAMPPPWAQGSAVAMPLSQQGHRRKNSAFSAHSEGVSAASSPPASPTLTMAFSPLDGIEEKERERDEIDSRKEKEMGKDSFRKHRYTGSAESISYTKEEDPVQGGKPRWVLERRRTGEGGEVELEREVVLGGI